MNAKRLAEGSSGFTPPGLRPRASNGVQGTCALHTATARTHANKTCLQRCRRAILNARTYEEMGEGVDGEPDSDHAVQAAPDYSDVFAALGKATQGLVQLNFLFAMRLDQILQHLRSDGADT